MINDGISDEKLSSFIRFTGGYSLYIRVDILFCHSHDVSMDKSIYHITVSQF